MRGNRRLLASLLVVSFLAIAFSGFQSLRVVRAKTSVAELPSMSLTVVGADGTQVVLNETDIGNLASYRAYGGFKNSLGFLKGLGNYTGVPLSMLCDLVGGLTSTSIVNVTASDYSKAFSFDEVVNGNFTTFSPATTEEVPHSKPLVPIVAYYFNDANIGSSDGGPLRLAIVGSEGLATNSTYWVKWVVRVEVVDFAVPEFQPSMVLPLLILATLAAALSLKVRRQRLDRLSQFGRLIDVVCDG